MELSLPEYIVAELLRIYADSNIQGFRPTDVLFEVGPNVFRRPNIYYDVHTSVSSLLGATTAYVIEKINAISSVNLINLPSSIVLDVLEYSDIPVTAGRMVVPDTVYGNMYYVITHINLSGEYKEFIVRSLISAVLYGADITGDNLDVKEKIHILLGS
jgi:hypothetical protein